MADPARNVNMAINEAPSTPLQALSSIPQVERVTNLVNDDGAVGGRSPSVIPAPPDANIPVGDSRLFPDDTGVTDGDPADNVLHVDSAHFDSDDEPASMEVDSTPMTLTELDPPTLSAREWMVPLSLPGRLKDDYYKALANNQDVVQRLFKAQALTPDLRKDAYNLIDKLTDLCTHPDLNDPTALGQVDLEGSKEFESWSEHMSSKFAFLKNLCRHLKDEPMHVIVVCHPGPVVDLLQRFLRALGYLERGQMTQTLGLPAVPLQVSVRVLDSAAHLMVNDRANLVIAFDSAYRPTHPAIVNWRQGGLPTAPVIHPAVFGSPEHIVLCMPRNIRGDHALKALMHFIVQIRKQCGELDADQLNAVAAGEEVAEWIKRGGRESQWTLPPIHQLMLRGLELIPATQMSGNTPEDPFGPSIGSSQVHLLHVDTANSLPLRSDTPLSSRKRILEPAIASPGSPLKKARMQNGVGSQVDSGLLATGLMPSVSTQTQAQQDIVGVRTALDGSDISNERIAALQTLVMEHQKSLDNAFNLRDHIKEQLGITQNERDDLLRDNEKLEKQLQDKSEANTKLQGEVDGLQQRLRTVQAEAEANASPTAEGEKGKSGAPTADPAGTEQLKQANNEIQQLQRARDALKVEIEFVREQYQARDSDAGGMRRENEELREQIRRLHAEAENARSKERSAVLRRDAAESQERWLKSQAASLRQQLQKKDKERGRGMATRSGSTAPRSPRVAGASPVGSRVVSRHGSPVRREGVASRRGRQLQALEG